MCNLVSFKVLRAQLPRDNTFYTDAPHEDEVEMKEETTFKYPYIKKEKEERKLTRL